MKYLAIIVGKMLVFLGGILNRGSSLPGKVALKIDKKLLSKLKYPSVRIFVTGSSGKGSTARMIANTLEKQGFLVCFNDAGSNLDRGIVSSMLKNMSLTGKIKSDYLVMEIDERYIKKVGKDVLPTHIVITNITKDQPPRQFNTDVIYKEILTGVNKDTILFLNMDDPYLRNFEKDIKNKIIYYSLDKNKYSYKTQIFENLNVYFCPYCLAFLKYEYYNFEALGKYSCPRCDFTYKVPEIVGKNLDLDKEIIEVGDNTIQIGGDLLYNAYNTLLAYTVLCNLEVPVLDIVKSINEFNQKKDNYFRNKKKVFYGLSAKAENATTFNQSIFKIINDKEKKDIIIGWKEISRRYQHYDISWLYDIEFELLNNDSLENIYACGIDAENIKKRLILAGISEDKIITAENILEIRENVLNDNVKSVYGILNFDYVEEFNDNFREEKND